MNHVNHHKVVRLAVAALPESSCAFWRSLAPSIEATCMLPDEVAIPLLNGEDGPWRHYFPPEIPRHSFEKCGASARAHFFDMRHPLAHTLAQMHAGNLDEACRFLGVFAHHLGDFSEPAHYYEREITLLLPPPPDRVNCNPHRMIEDTVSTIAAIDGAPRVLGDSLDTLLFRLEGRCRELYETTLGVIVPMFGAIYRRDAAAAAECVNPVVGRTAAVFADVLHTLWCMHADTWTADERRALGVCRLDQLEPAAVDVEFNYGCRPIRGAITIDKLARATPLQLRLDGGVRSVEGLCLIPHALPIRGTQYLSAVEFDLPPGAFRRLTASIGLLAGVLPQAVCRFVVELDGRPVYGSPELREADAAQAMVVDIAGARRLRLAVHTDGSTDKLAYPIWARPTLEVA